MFVVLNAFLCDMITEEGFFLSLASRWGCWKSECHTRKHQMIKNYRKHCLLQCLYKNMCSLYSWILQPVYWPRLDLAKLEKFYMVQLSFANSLLLLVWHWDNVAYWVSALLEISSSASCEKTEICQNNVNYARVISMPIRG